MLAVFALVFASQQVSVRIGADDKTKADSIRRMVRDSIRMEVREREIDRDRRPPRRIPVTPELDRTAFVDTAARTLLLHARDARLRQDSTLLAYDATAYQRLSVGLGFRSIGRDRLLFRTENASRVRWSRTSGVWIDLKGRRTAFPMLKDGEGDAEIDDMSPVPYFPGREALWIGTQTTKAEVDERELVHPIALGSEAYYRFATGDSLTITLSDGKSIRLRELRIEPRRPEWRLSVGSFWFDVSTGQLVRAVYRLAVPLDIWRLVDEENAIERQERQASGRRDHSDDDVPVWVKGLMSPMQANLEAVTIEYGLYGGHFWLPRAQYAEGWARASFMRIPFKIEESFKYASVNGTDTLPPIPTAPSRRALRDSLFGGDSTRWRDLPDSVRRERMQKLAAVDSVRRLERAAKRERDCQQTGFYTTVDSRYDGQVRAAIRMPCDTTVLAKSPDLPPSIYDSGDELFGVAERDELLKSLSFSLQPGWAPQKVRWNYGLSLMRYNRVEGLSLGLQGNQDLGLGYSWDGTVRLGLVDTWPNADVGFSRSNGRHTLRIGAYRRLAAANDDWGNPLSFGASLGAMLYGRDEGYYYRSTGAELTRTLVRGGGFSTRLFIEHHGDAPADAEFNVSRALGGASRFQPNIPVFGATLAGIGLRDQRTLGLDPLGWRLFSDVRLEGGWISRASEDSTPGSSWVRAAGDLTVTRGFGSVVAAALTLGAGVSDRAPLERQFFLGGAQTVRGQLFGSEGGPAYWRGRLELGSATGPVRPVIFGDIGWAGARDLWKSPGRPLSGAGVGASVLDGLIRLDLSRGIYPRQRMRLDLYVDARF